MADAAAGARRKAALPHPVARDGVFTPPYPDRPRSRLPLPELVRRLRRNMLEVWHERQFTEPLIATALLGRRILICNSPETVQDAFIRQAEAFERKSPQQRHALEPLVGDGLIISDGLVWKDRRRVVAPVTHASRIADLAPVMTEAVAERAAAWAARDPAQPFDMLAEMGALAAEVICRSVFGRALGEARAGQVVSAFAAYQRKVSAGGLLALIGAPPWLHRLQGWRLRPEVRRIHDVLEAMIEAALSAPESEPSLIRAMAEAELAGSGQPMSRTAFRNEAATLFLAGHETTASTMAWCWYLLSQDRRSADRLRAEARAVLGGRPAGFEDLPKLPFARAVVEETLRLYPPIPVLAREAQREVVLGGRTLPQGGLVMVVPWLLHRHKALWERPDAFLPDRFLPGAPPRPRHAYVPFSLGPRVCTGAHFAMAEAAIVLATLGQRFAPRLAPGAKVFPVARLTLRPGETLPMLPERAG
ncbi:cytochrome P450 [Siccirubricoccus sp. KC 17139]|uniref:Cytochrome P450 n=1 Tax=Siccirubricoccus soli TaxID=2899147 RepID=A0ABT1D072_9PROT|nr:cytochrome P450 [Siccirubricoccus soli]MCP2681450.1 cytochrome P450 [Siccirubricoccus soli]